MIEIVETVQPWEILLQDNLDFLRAQKDKSFDLVIADPWYGIGMTRNDTTGFAKRRFRQTATRVGSDAKGFQDEAPSREFFDQVRRVGKKVWIWGGNYFQDTLGSCRGPYIWDKGTGANYFADGEMAWNNVLNCMRIFHHQWCGAIRSSEAGARLIHPCQKPVALFKDIIARSRLKPGSRILDTNCGSGSAVIAARDLGFNVISCEISPLYHRAAVERVTEYFRQASLFAREELHPELFDERIAQ